MAKSQIYMTTSRMEVVYSNLLTKSDPPSANCVIQQDVLSASIIIGDTSRPCRCIPMIQSLSDYEKGFCKCLIIDSDTNYNRTTIFYICYNCNTGNICIDVIYSESRDNIMLELEFSIKESSKNVDVKQRDGS